MPHGRGSHRAMVPSTDWSPAGPAWPDQAPMLHPGSCGGRGHGHGCSPRPRRILLAGRRGGMEQPGPAVGVTWGRRVARSTGQAGPAGAPRQGLSRMAATPAQSRRGDRTPRSHARLCPCLGAACSGGVFQGFLLTLGHHGGKQPGTSTASQSPAHTCMRAYRAENTTALCMCRLSQCVHARMCVYMCKHSCSLCVQAAVMCTHE